jgi:hypothetical protein
MEGPVWWCKSIISALERLRQEEHKFEDSLSREILSQIKKKKEKHRKNKQKECMGGRFVSSHKPALRLRLFHSLTVQKHFPSEFSTPLCNRA